MRIRTRFENNHEKGFLLIAAIILLFIFSTVGSMLAYSYMKKGVAVYQSKQAQQALYIATSGLGMAKRALINGTETCTGIAGDALFTNASLLGGKFTVTGTGSKANNTLSSTISTSSTSLTLSNAKDFAEEGVVKIDNEYIGYYSKLNNTLNNLKRGLSVTTAATHNAAAATSQDDCLLMSTGAIPDFTSVSGQASVQEILSSSTSAASGFSVDTSVLMSASTIDVNGNTNIINRGVTVSDSHLAGSNLRTGADFKVNGSVATYVGNGSGGTVLSSKKDSIKSDIMQYDTSITKANMYTHYFSQPLSTVYGIADHSYTINNVSGVKAKTVWIEAPVKLMYTNNITLGTPSEPVVLIINGDFDIIHTTKIQLYGLIYVIGDININGTVNIVGNGAIVTEGQAKLRGTTVLDLNPSAVGDMSVANPYMASDPTYSSNLFRRVVT